MRYEVVLDLGETPNKCTIAPLEQRPDFVLFRVSRKRENLGPFTVPLLLHHQGTCLTKIRKAEGSASDLGIGAIDCVWNRLDELISRVTEPLPTFVKIPDGFETAYPRKSSLNTDPDGGLATIEAIFVGAALLGKWDISLFQKYYFGKKFIELNQKLFLDLGVTEARDLSSIPDPLKVSRNSRQRKLDRGWRDPKGES